MEPVKFEEHIKEQLQKREIKPSEGSWEKLQQRLDRQGKPSRQNSWWLGAIAAVAVVFFMLGTFFNSPVETNSHQVVDTSDKEEVKTAISEEPEKAIVEMKEKASAFTQKSEPEILPQKKNQKRQEPFVQSSGKIAAISDPEIQEKEIVDLPQKEQLPVTAAQIAQYSIDSEVEALLLVANVEIENDPDFEVQTVSAGELLNEVEHELEMNFRQKVFEVLKDGFSKAKTAVANRN